MRLQKLGLVLVMVSLVVVSYSFAALGQEVDGGLPEDISQNIITAISVEGNNEVSEEEILEQIETEVGDSVEHEQLQEDMHSVFDLGYFFDIQINFRHHEGGVMLIFEVIENPILDQIVIEGNQEVSESELRDLLDLNEGELLNVNQLNQGRDAIDRYYEENGYILAQVVDMTIRNEDELHIVIEEGQVNEIKITGNEDTKDFVIRRELSMQSGDVFNVQTMEQDLRSVYNLGYFQDVRPNLQPIPGDPHKADLEINVEEQKTNTFSIGGGYSSQAGLTGLIDLELENFRGRGQKASLNLEHGGKKEVYEIGYYRPWTFGTPTSLDFNLYWRDEEVTGDDDVQKRGGNVTVGRPLTDNTEGRLGFRADQIREDEDEDWTNERSLTLSTIRDTRRNRMNPRTGSRSQFSLQHAGLLGGDRDFTKYETDLRKYLPSRTENAWAFRLKLGGSSGELPSDQRYSLSGMDGIRGYSSDYYSSSNNPEENGFIGDSVMLGNLEYRFPIVDRVTGVSFVDVGRTFEDNFRAGDLRDLKYSVGAGVRFNTPVGQIGLDYGYAPDGHLDDNTDFSIRLGNRF